jgi:hypothetical protein
MKLTSLLLPGVLLAPISMTLADTAMDSSGMLDSVIVTAHRVVPTSLPSEIPTTMEGITKEEVERTVNATECWGPALGRVFYTDDQNGNDRIGDLACCPF